MPSYERLNPVKYFSNKIAVVVKENGLEGTVHLPLVFLITYFDDVLQFMK